MSDRQSRDGASPDKGVYHFLDFELDLGAGELRRAGETLVLTRQQFALLDTLVRANGRTVSREALLREVWGAVVVSEGAVRQAVWELRRLIGVDGEKVIEAVRGRGYRLLPRVVARAAASPLDQPPRSAYGGLLGRDLELQELERMRDGALHRAGRACVLIGPAGVGKSRLAREIIERATSDGVPCSESYADREGALPPLWPWTQLLEACLRDAGDSLRTRCRTLAPKVFAWLESGASSVRAWPLQEPSERRLGLFEQLSRALSALLREPRVCLIEDMQWADEASLAFFAHHVRALPQTRALLIVTCRSADDGGGPALARALEALAQDPHNRRLQLSNLGPDEVAAMLAPQRGDPPVGALAAHVHALTGGNPLFVSELARALDEQAVRRDGLLELDSAALQPVIERRLRRLPPTVLPALQAAAALGRDFAVVELEAVLDLSPRDVLSRIDDCLQSGFVVETGEHRFSFAHPLLQQAAYASLTYSQRSLLHERIARWLESLDDASSPRLVSELAHHFYQAAGSGQLRKALDYARKAAEAALAATAYGAAAAHFQRAVRCAELLGDCAPAERIALELSHLEAVHAERGLTEEIRSAYRSLADRARAWSLRELYARAALGYAGHQHTRYVPARFAAAIDPHEVKMLEQALADLGPSGSELRVLVLCSLAYALSGARDTARCRELLREAFEQAETIGEPALLARVLSFRIFIGTGPGRLADTLAACDAMVELTLRHGLAELELDARIARYLFLFCRTDRSSAMRDAERAAQLAETLGTDRAKSRAQLPALIDAFGTGRLQEAQRLADRARDAAPDDPNQQVIWMARSATVQMLSGQVDPSLTVAGYEFLLSANPLAVNLRALLSSAYATLGRSDDARREFDALAADDFAALPDDINWLPTMALLADAAVILRDADRARLLYHRLLPHAGEFFFFGVETTPGAAIALWIGDLAVLLDDFESAQALLDRAQAIHGALGFTLLDQYCALARARLLLASRSSGASRGARELLSQVRQFATEREVSWLSKCADDIDRSMAVSSGDVLDLTPRLAAERRRGSDK